MLGGPPNERNTDKMDEWVAAVEKLGINRARCFYPTG